MEGKHFFLTKGVCVAAAPGTFKPASYAAKIVPHPNGPKFAHIKVRAR